MDIKKVIAIQNISVYNFVVVTHSIVDMETPLKYTQCACAVLLLMRIYSFRFGHFQSLCMHTKAGTSLMLSQLSDRRTPQVHAVCLVTDATPMNHVGKSAL